MRTRRRRSRAPIPGSAKAQIKGAEIVGKPAGDEEVEVSVYVRRGTRAAEIDRGSFSRPPPRERTYLSRAKLAALSGADRDDLARVERFALDHDLRWISSAREQRRVSLWGTPEEMSRAFGVELKRYEHPSGTYRGHDEEISLPGELDGVVECVLGLDDRAPRARDSFLTALADAIPAFSPFEVANIYEFPSFTDDMRELTGAGECIAILRTGGYYAPGEIDTYFRTAGLPAPQVCAFGKVSVNTEQAKDETLLDITVAGHIAPGARIVVYFAPEGCDEIAYSHMIEYALWNDKAKPSIMSISWGFVESEFSESGQRHIDGVFADAACLGITVCAASGDFGSPGFSPDAAPDALAHAVFPASSPHVLACGGTRLEPSAEQLEPSWSEVVWRGNYLVDLASGGGVSDTFDLPVWQEPAAVPASGNPGGRIGRGIPDVAGHAGGYADMRDNKVIGGTSAVAPLWAGLIARINEGLGTRAGYLNELLYTRYHEGPGQSAFRPIVSGDNSVPVAVESKDEDGRVVAHAETPPFYTAGPGWNACTGLGSPRGQNLFELLQ